MEEVELHALADGFTEAAIEEIDRAVSPLATRVKALEDRPIGVFSTGIGAPTFDGGPGDVYLDSKTGDVYQWR